MLFHAKWDIRHNIDLQFGGKRSQISNLGDALRVYHHKYSANSSDPSVCPIPVSLYDPSNNLYVPSCVSSSFQFFTQIGGKRSQILKCMAWLWYENLAENLHRTRTPLANFLFWRPMPLQVLAIILLRLLGYNIVPPGCIAPHDIYFILFNSIFISSILVSALIMQY